jgi:UDP-glucose 4-epimerase
MVIPRLVRQALAGQPLTVYGDGTQRRVFCHVRDVTQVLADLMERDDVYGEVFNIGGQEEVSISELAELVRDLSDSSSEIVTVPYDDAYEPGFEDMVRRVPNIEKIRAVTGWQPQHTLQEIITGVIEHHRVIGANV